MLSIDEAIEQFKYDAECNRADLDLSYAEDNEQIANWLEELKVIKEIDLSIPQHFTKEQSDWIKKYCINRNKEFYNKALDDFVKFASNMPTVEAEDGTIRPMWLEEMAKKLKENTMNKGYQRMTKEEIIDELEIYTVGRLNKSRVHITVEELQRFIDAIKALEQSPKMEQFAEQLKEQK